MALKSLVIVSILIAAMAAAPTTQAQGLITGLIQLIRIQGAVFCTVDGNIGVNGTATPPFPNALVQLQCNGNVVANATTNSLGVFSIVLNPLSIVLPSLLNNCRLVVATPLATCNATLPTVGTLTSTLQSAGSTNVGLLNILNIIPRLFIFQN